MSLQERVKKSKFFKRYEEIISRNFEALTFPAEREKALKKIFA